MMQSSASSSTAAPVAPGGNLPTLLSPRTQDGKVYVLLEDLRLKTQAGLQVTGQAFGEQALVAHRAFGEQAAVAKGALAERAAIARAGTKLWNEGASTVVLAKKAALDTAALDAEFLGVALPAARAACQQAAGALRKAGVPSSGSDGAPSKEDQDGSLARLAEEQEARAKAYGEAMELLSGSPPARAPELSAPEWDALRLAQIGRGCQEASKAATETTKIAAGQASRQVTVAADALRTKTAVAASSDGLDEANNSSNNTLLPRLRDLWERPAGEHATTAKRALGEQATVAHSALDQRVGVLRSGLKLWNDGATATVLAKKAALDSATMDADLLVRAEGAKRAFRESAAGLRAAFRESAAGPASEAAVAVSFARLAEEHEARAKAYEKVLDVLGQPARTVELSAPEWDALRLAQFGCGCQEATRVAADTTKVAAENVATSVSTTARRAKQACC
jgi:hypothetical protein